MERREAQLARVGKRPKRNLRELDYLLGVFDGHRLGGLRFRIGEGPFLDDNTELASPPWTSLRELVPTFDFARYARDLPIADPGALGIYHAAQAKLNDILART